MKQHCTDERTGISYTLQENYYLPDLELPAEEQQPIGVWGMRHKRYLRENHRALYANFMTSGKLVAYLDESSNRQPLCFSGW